MKLISLEVGVMHSNNYIVVNEACDKGVLIDCSGDGSEVVLAAQQAGITISAIILTHGHSDHIEGIDKVVQAFACPVYIHSLDLGFLDRPEYNLSTQLYGKPLTVEARAIAVSDGDVIEEAGLAFEVIHTPGHTQGSICLLCDKILFTGDTLFRNSIGNDFPPFGNINTEIESIQSCLFTLKKDYACYPGHGEPTELFYEMKNNMYCRI
ncbi:MAG: MBL fold metallo-hydrolase [Clostridia bacterium]|nr:MBL fold metallo-hydrolase [Clostridia bacterium]